MPAQGHNQDKALYGLPRAFVILSAGPETEPFGAHPHVDTFCWLHSSLLCLNGAYSWHPFTHWQHAKLFCRHICGVDADRHHDAH